MAKILSALNMAFALFLAWALWADITNDINQWWGTSLLVFAVLNTGVTSIFLWGRKTRP